MVAADVTFAIVEVEAGPAEVIRWAAAPFYIRSR
jgi:hypothetical protein